MSCLILLQSLRMFFWCTLCLCWLYNITVGTSSYCWYIIIVHGITSFNAFLNDGGLVAVALMRMKRDDDLF